MAKQLAKIVSVDLWVGNIGENTTDREWKFASSSYRENHRPVWHVTEHAGASAQVFSYADAKWRNYEEPNAAGVVAALDGYNPEKADGRMLWTLFNMRMPEMSDAEGDEGKADQLLWHNRRWDALCEIARNVSLHTKQCVQVSFRDGDNARLYHTL